MFQSEHAKLLMFHALSPIHAGSGSSTGAVDLPIQRERHTARPIVQSSGLKGALREAVERSILVLCQLIILGYREVSFVRASSMVNCHWTPRWFSFVAAAQASVSSRKSSMSSVRRPLRHCRVMQLNSFSAMFNQLPCLGV